MLYTSTVATATTDPMMDKTQQHQFHPSNEIHRRNATDTVAKNAISLFLVRY